MQAWSQLPAAGSPSPREDHTWTADGSGQVAYLFGGRDGAKVYDDLWSFDLGRNRWQRLAPTGARPDARFGHTATWVDRVGLVLWSGQAGNRFFNDVWAYLPRQNSWSKLPNRGAVPAARYGSCASLGPDGRLWISHGFTQDNGRFSDTRAYDFSSGTWTDETPAGAIPVIRCLHDCVWTGNGRLVLYGGQTTGVAAIGDLWTLGLGSRGKGTWKRQPEPPPPARNLYAAAAVGNALYVFGGTALQGRKLGDLWVLDVARLTWSKLEVARPPVARSGAAFVADPSRGRLLLFGGITDDRAVGDTWQLTLGG